MAKLNIFKIDENKQEDFKNSLYEENHERIVVVDETEYNVTLCAEMDPGDSGLSWQGILNQFNIPTILLNKQPKGILYVEIDNNIYAATFGSAFNKAEKFCDRNFAFKVARKFKYEKIKSTSLANPNSNKNKVINSYLDSEYFEYDSGSAFLKIKAKLKLEEGFELFDNNIEIGTSIKLNAKQATLDYFIKIVNYLQEISDNEDQTPIPVFQEIKNIDEINELNNNLKNNVDFDDLKFSFSDFDIIGTTEVFYSQSSVYRISYNHYSKKVDYLDIDAIKSFCEEKSLELRDVIFDICVKIDNENGFEKLKLIDMIDYTNDEKMAVLIKGKWYKFNDDYIANLNQSLRDVLCEHLVEFDFCQDLYDEYIDQLFTNYRNDPNYEQKSDSDLKTLIKKKYYKELVFNKLMEDTGNYQNGDRSLVKVDGTRIEIDDLYKDQTIYAVKIGNSSSKLCYVVDQMDLSMRLIKNHEINYPHNVSTISLVLIIDKKENYPDGDDVFDITQLGYLALKNAINNWQKNARLLCYAPKVIIGYNR